MIYYKKIRTGAKSEKYYYKCVSKKRYSVANTKKENKIFNLLRINMVMMLCIYALYN